MPTNLSGRITVILLVTFAALWSIFPTFDLRNPDLKPGIDMVGGTSLLYEIKRTEDASYDPQLVEKVAAALKKRVDPDGVRNLIWRPQGQTRLEIQMPLSGKGGEAIALRDKYVALQRELEAGNIRVGEAVNAVERLSGDQRRAQLEQLAQGNEKRATILGAMASIVDQLSAVRGVDASKQAELEVQYDRLREQLLDTNITVAELESILELKPETQAARLSELRQRAGEQPGRAKALDQFVELYPKWKNVKDSIDNAADLKRLLRGSGVLAFHILYQDYGSPEYQRMVEQLQRRGPRPMPEDTVRWFEVDKPTDFSHPTVTYNDRQWVLAYVTPDKSMAHTPGQPSSWALESAQPQLTDGERKVGFRFNPGGAKLFGELTGANVGRPLAIVLDQKVISAPNINQQIFAQGEISGGRGGFSQAELNYLVSTLSAGSLPAQLTDDPISERTVGPQLGADNLRAGFIACGFGLVVVAVFLIGYYYLAGMVAFFAVVLNLLIVLGVMAMINATFTLPGVAGIVLSIGAAVDANVLIFERLREEQHRGLSLRMALRNAYDRAFSAIVDSNATTLITSLILYWLGSEEVKGFGITLLIGLVASLFTALFVTKTIFALLIDKFGITKLGSLPLTLPWWDKFLQPKIDWMSKAWILVCFSAVILLVGGYGFIRAATRGELLDIEFSSGTSVQFELRQPAKIEQIRQLLSKADPKILPAPSVVSVGTGDTTYEVITPNAETRAVREEVLRLIGKDKLKIEFASKFEGVGEPVDAVMDRLVFLIKDSRFNLDGYTPRSAGSYVGGAVMVLRGIDPPLSAKQLKDRIDRQRLQPQPGQRVTYKDFTVESAEDPDVPVSTAYVLVNDPGLPFDRNPERWRDEVASPMWTLLGDAINKEESLQSVKNVDASVAGDTQRNAMVAITLSILVIMAYIWLRFGDLIYGTATMVAMIHDTLLVLAAVGLAHLFANTLIGDVLLLEPFRVNLTLIAAVLTVMSYSMLDTIVVFDRVRENRGKLGVVTREVINDSINQTLSRTILTGGTNIFTVAVMYAAGGPGIHGFTFVLLIGIVVGTYSSIAIAAPLLLIRGKEASARAGNRVGQLQRA
jgi:SecD/SecF fusion protein